MFRRKQNQTVQLISITPQGTRFDDHLHQQTVKTNSSGGNLKQQQSAGGSDVKMTPARRSRSLEGNLDNFDYLTITEQNKRKEPHMYGSHPHSLDATSSNCHGDSNPQTGTGAFSVGPTMGRRLHIVATPPSSSSSSPPSDQIPTTTMAVSEQQRDSDKAILENTTYHMSKKGEAGEADEDMVKMKFEELKMAPSSMPLTHHAPAHDQSKSATKTNYPEPDGDPFRGRTDTTNSVKFDISYDL